MRSNGHDVYSENNQTVSEGRAPRVAVVIPTFNRRRDCLRAIASVIAQTYQDFTMVVVVDGSSDGTDVALDRLKAAFPERLQDRFQVILQDNLGVSAARNTGIRATGAQFIALLDDDDIWAPEKLKTQMTFLDESPTNDEKLCTTDFICVQKAEGSSRLMDCEGCPDLSRQIKLGYFPPPSTWLFSRQAFERVGGFDERVHAGEDVDFVMMLRKERVPISNLSRSLTTYNDGGSGKIYRKQDESAARVLSKHCAWWRQVLSSEDLSTIIQWYKGVLSEETFSRIWQTCND